MSKTKQMTDKLPRELTHKLTHVRKHSCCAIVLGVHSGTTTGRQQNHKRDACSD